MATQQDFNQPFEWRRDRAQALTVEASAAERRGMLGVAYQKLTDAHDLVVDCPRMHGLAHDELRRVNRKMGNYGELAGDWFLYFARPFGIFTVLAYALRRNLVDVDICRHR
ncbi:hypothetical protein A9Q99_02175 [Gammaproteobacteria bacterium 45_16_T64]|nr:hypothetical protein A9Q99_02175 [Gammaproteobacteria bacterium 45_16_T64]